MSRSGHGDTSSAHGPSSSANKQNVTEPEEEIQVIEPLPKTPPLCIDLDEDSSSPATSSTISSTDKNKTNE